MENTTKNRTIISLNTFKDELSKGAGEIKESIQNGDITHKTSINSKKALLDATNCIKKDIAHAVKSFMTEDKKAIFIDSSLCSTLEKVILEDCSHLGKKIGPQAKEKFTQLVLEKKNTIGSQLSTVPYYEENTSTEQTSPLTEREKKEESMTPMEVEKKYLLSQEEITLFLSLVVRELQNELFKNTQHYYAEIYQEKIHQKELGALKMFYTQLPILLNKHFKGEKTYTETECREQLEKSMEKMHTRINTSDLPLWALDLVTRHIKQVDIPLYLELTKEDLVNNEDIASPSIEQLEDVLLDERRTYIMMQEKYPIGKEEESKIEELTNKGLTLLEIIPLLNSLFHGGLSIRTQRDFLKEQNTNDKEEKEKEEEQTETVHTVLAKIQNAHQTGTEIVEDDMIKKVNLESFLKSSSSRKNGSKNSYNHNGKQKSKGVLRLPKKVHPFTDKEDALDEIVDSIHTSYQSFGKRKFEKTSNKQVRKLYNALFQEAKYADYDPEEAYTLYGEKNSNKNSTPPHHEEIRETREVETGTHAKEESRENETNDITREEVKRLLRELFRTTDSHSHVIEFKNTIVAVDYGVPTRSLSQKYKAFIYELLQKKSEEISTQEIAENMHKRVKKETTGKVIMRIFPKDILESILTKKQKALLQHLLIKSTNTIEGEYHTSIHTIEKKENVSPEETDILNTIPYSSKEALSSLFLEENQTVILSLGQDLYFIQKDGAFLEHFRDVENFSTLSQELFQKSKDTWKRENREKLAREEKFIYKEFSILFKKLEELFLTHKEGVKKLHISEIDYHTRKKVELLVQQNTNTIIEQPTPTQNTTEDSTPQVQKEEKVTHSLPTESSNRTINTPIPYQAKGITIGRYSESLGEHTLGKEPRMLQKKNTFENLYDLTTKMPLTKENVKYLPGEALVEVLSYVQTLMTNTLKERNQIILANYHQLLPHCQELLQNVETTSTKIFTLSSAIEEELERTPPQKLFMSIYKHIQGGKKVVLETEEKNMTSILLTEEGRPQGLEQEIQIFARLMNYIEQLFSLLDTIEDYNNTLKYYIDQEQKEWGKINNYATNTLPNLMALSPSGKALMDAERYQNLQINTQEERVRRTQLMSEIHSITQLIQSIDDSIPDLTYNFSEEENTLIEKVKNINPNPNINRLAYLLHLYKKVQLCCKIQEEKQKDIVVKEQNMKQVRVEETLHTPLPLKNLQQDLGISATTTKADLLLPKEQIIHHTEDKVIQATFSHLDHIALSLITILSTGRGAWGINKERLVEYIQLLLSSTEEHIGITETEVLSQITRLCKKDRSFTGSGPALKDWYTNTQYPLIQWKQTVTNSDKENIFYRSTSEGVAFYTSMKQFTHVGELGTKEFREYHKAEQDKRKEAYTKYLADMRARYGQ